MFDEDPDGDPHGECAEEIDWLRAEVERLRAIVAKAEHWARHAMLMRSSQNAELLSILTPNAQAQPAERSEARLQRNVVREDKR